MRHTTPPGAAGAQAALRRGRVGRGAGAGAHCSRRWMVVAGSLVVAPRRSAARPAAAPQLATQRRPRDAAGSHTSGESSVAWS